MLSLFVKNSFLNKTPKVKYSIIISRMWSRYLLWFAHEHLDFRYAEINSILSLYDIPIKYIEKTSIDKPYWIVELPNEECLKKIASRSVSLKNCVELWARAKSEDQLHKNLKAALENKTGQWILPNDDIEMSDVHVCPRELIDKCSSVDKSFKIDMETFCNHFTMKEKVAKIENFSYLPIAGPVKLKNPDVTLSYIEFYGIEPNNVPEKPYDLFFGRWITDGQRDLIKAHSLKTRSFIGNTSMDAQLAILMANQALVRPGDVVVDPFVGSGSLLVAAAHFGAYVCGSDIDYMMLHARTRPTRVGMKVRKKEESIRGNMRQYNTEHRYLDVVVSDFSQPLWREDFRFDAVITDPPYGVREPTEKVGIDREDYVLEEEHLHNHVPSKVEYGLEQLFHDLVTFAATSLRIGGRLVTWYPVVRSEWSDTLIPTHPSLSLLHNSEQVLSSLTSRRLLTFQKICEPDLQGAKIITVGYNFREKYFSSGEQTRKERKEKRAQEILTFQNQLANRKKQNCDNNNT